MYNCAQHKTLYMTSVSVLCMLVMLLIMLPILPAARFFSSTSQSKSAKFWSTSPSIIQRAHMSDSDISRRTCCSKASRVGGQLALVPLICANKYFWHLSTVLCWQVLSYMGTTKCSIISRCLVEISSDRDSLIKVSITSRKAFYTSNTVGLPRPRNSNTVSHPSYAYQKLTALHTLSPSNSA